MAKKALNETVYRCPFCNAEIWFNEKHDLARHLWTDHLRESLDEIARQNKTQISKTKEKWFIK